MNEKFPPLRAFGLLVRLCPGDFRRSHGEEILTTLRERLSAGAFARRRRLQFLAGEWLNLFWTCLREWALLLKKRLPQRSASARGSSKRNRGTELMITLRSDVRFALRMLAKHPFVSLAAVLTLGFGIGVNAALYSVVRGVLLKPLPYDRPQQLAMIWSQWKDFEKTWVSEPEYLYYLQQAKSFEDIALFAAGSAALTGSQGAERVRVYAVTPNTFEVLGTAPTIGRTFTEDEAVLDQPVALISHDLWMARYAGSSSIVGRKAMLDGRPYSVIGVLPAGFRLPVDFSSQAPAQVFLPYTFEDSATASIPYNGGDHGAYSVARLRAGVTAEQAGAEMAALGERLTGEGVYTQDWNFRPIVIPVSDEILGEVRPVLFVLLGAVALVLLTACANVAGLLLAQGRERAAEIALRGTLGAGPGRLIRQMLTEGLILSMVSGALAAGLAWLSIRLLPRMAPADLPRLGDVGLDWSVLGFAALIALATTLIFGLAPALQAARVRVQSSLQQESSRTGSRFWVVRFQRLLTAAQLALAVVLLLGTGLLVRTFQSLSNIDPGFRTDHLLTLRLEATESGYPNAAAVTAFYRTLLERLRSLPGVGTVGASRVLPLAGRMGESGVAIEGYQRPEGASNPTAQWQIVTPGYLESLGIRLVRGRLITEADDYDAPQVILINEAMARRYWPDRDPLGARIRVFGGPGVPWQTIVGIVSDVRHNGLTEGAKEKWYRPHAQFPVSGWQVRSMTVVIRSDDDDPLQLSASVREVIHGMDPEMPISNLRSMEQVVAAAVARPRFTMLLMSLFSGLALLVSSFGIYASSSYAAGCRTQEIGIRLALGARPRQVMRLMVRQGMLGAALGVAAGIAASLALTGLLKGQLHGVSAQDPLTYLSVSVSCAAIALAACSMPAWRASKANPQEILQP